MTFTCAATMQGSELKLNQFNLVLFWLSEFILHKNIHCSNKRNIDFALSFISVGKWTRKEFTIVDKKKKNSPSSRSQEKSLHSTKRLETSSWGVGS